MDKKKVTSRKKAGIAGGGAAAVTLAAVILLSGGSKSEIELTYNISPKNEYVSVMEIDAPDEANIDIAVLYLNGQEVDKTVLPKGRFETIPLVLEDLSRLEIELYRSGSVVGRGQFKDGTLRGEIDK